MIDVSQASVTTYARCSGAHDNHATVNLLENLPVKILKIG